MAKIIKVKTDSIFEEKASYSRLVSVDDWVFVSNTAGRNPVTKEIPEDTLEQLEQVFNNIELALKAVGSCLEDVIVSRVFIQNPEDTNKVMDMIGAKFKNINPSTTVTCPRLGSTIYKVEIEITAYKGASKEDAQIVRIPSQI